MRVKWFDEFLKDEDRASKIVINGAVAVTAIIFVLAVAAILWMK
jgi:hypothetical protein